MQTTKSRRFTHPIALAATTVMLAACADGTPLAPHQQPATSARAPERQPTGPASLAALTAEQHQALATLRRVTARYHDVNAAIADGFAFLHPCEVRPGEGAVASLYVHGKRLSDGIIDPELPDALLYAPAHNGRVKLVGVELAVFYVNWVGAEPPRFLGATFQREDEFAAFGLHVWVWEHNPNGMFAEANPRISCGAE